MMLVVIPAIVGATSNMYRAVGDNGASVGHTPGLGACVAAKSATGTDGAICFQPSDKQCVVVHTLAAYEAKAADPNWKCFSKFYS
jgi:hypothetical protein